MQIRQLAGGRFKDVADLGPMRDGVEPLALALASITYAALGDPDTEEPRDKDTAWQDPAADAPAPIHFEGRRWENNGQINWLVIETEYDEEEHEHDEVPSPDPSPVSDEFEFASVSEVIDLMMPLGAWFPTPLENREGLRLELLSPGLSGEDTNDGLALELVRDGNVWRHEFVIEHAWATRKPETRLGLFATYLTARASALQVAVQAVELVLSLVRGIEYRLGPHRCDTRLLDHNFDDRLDDTWVRENAGRSEVYLATLLLRPDLSVNERALIEWVAYRDPDLED
jgi:hypothetical protein